MRYFREHLSEREIERLTPLSIFTEVYPGSVRDGLSPLGEIWRASMLFQFVEPERERER